MKFGVKLMNTLFASFEPTEDVVELLTSLRQADMAWIAEEIETSIRNGHSVTRKIQGNQGKGNGHRIEPFDADEQLGITLRVIQRYTIEMQKLWYWTQDDLRETLENPNLQIAISYLGSQEPIHLFDENLDMHLARLDELLRRAWPHGTESYDIID